MFQNSILILKSKAFEFWQKQKYSIVSFSLVMLFLVFLEFYSQKNLKNELNNDSMYSQVVVTKTRYRNSFVNFDYFYIIKNDTIFDTESIGARKVGQANAKPWERIKGEYSKDEIIGTI